MKQRAYGFTIVELLIVIVVIAILAAISVVAYRGVSNSAYDSAVMADLNSFQKQMEVVKANIGRYPHDRNEFPDFKINKSAYDTRVNNVYYVVSHDDDSYTLGVRSKSGKGYFVSDTDIVQGVSSVNGNSTAQAAGFSSWCATGASCHQGYSSGSWSTAWKLVN